MRFHYSLQPPFFWRHNAPPPRNNPLSMLSETFNLRDLRNKLWTLRQTPSCIRGCEMKDRNSGSNTVCECCWSDIIVCLVWNSNCNLVVLFLSRFLTEASVTLDIFWKMLTISFGFTGNCWFQFWWRSGKSECWRSRFPVLSSFHCSPPTQACSGVRPVPVSRLFPMKSLPFPGFNLMRGWSVYSLVLAIFVDVVGQACTTQKARRAKLININSPRAAKVYFVIVWKKFWKDK